MENIKSGRLKVYFNSWETVKHRFRIKKKRGGVGGGEQQPTSKQKNILQKLFCRSSEGSRQHPLQSLGGRMKAEKAEQIMISKSKQGPGPNWGEALLTLWSVGKSKEALERRNSFQGSPGLSLQHLRICTVPNTCFPLVLHQLQSCSSAEHQPRTFCQSSPFSSNVLSSSITYHSTHGGRMRIRCVLGLWSRNWWF